MDHPELLMAGVYRLNRPALVVSLLTRMGESIPAGELFQAVGEPAAEDQTVGVIWNGKPMMMNYDVHSGNPGSV